jgi:hypothetical protein
MFEAMNRAIAANGIKPAIDKATGLAENLIVSAIEHGQVTSTKDLSGEWRIEDEELHRLYLSIAQDYCKRKSQLEPRRNEGTISEAHLADIAEGSVQQTVVDSIGKMRPHGTLPDLSA